MNFGLDTMHKCLGILTQPSSKSNNSSLISKIFGLKYN